MFFLGGCVPKGNAGLNLLRNVNTYIDRKNLRVAEWSWYEKYGYMYYAHAFADDTQLYLPFNPDNSLNEAEAVHAME